MEESEETLLRECRLGHVEEVQTLLEARAADPESLDINCKGTVTLCFAELDNPFI